MTIRRAKICYAMVMSLATAYMWYDIFFPFDYFETN